MDLESAREANLRGNDCLQRGDYDAAIAEYQVAVRQDPDAFAYPRERGIIFANLGYALSLSGKLTDAAAAYREALAREPRRANYHNELGDVLYRLEDWSGAVTAYHRAAQLEAFVRVYPESPGLIQYNLGMAYFRLGDLEAARRHFQESCRREPENQRFQESLATVSHSKPKPASVTHSNPQTKETAGTTRVTFSEVGGCDEAKRIISQAVKLVLEADRARKYKIGMNGILLYGPPGTGKTFLAEATAGEFNLNFIRVCISDITSKWAGESVEKLKQVFDRASGGTPTLLFFDDLDSLAGKMQGDATMENRRLFEAFVQHVEKIRATPSVVLVGATSRMDTLEAAAIRPGRFDWHIPLHQPDTEERHAVLEHLLTGRPVAELDLPAWAERTKGCSAADLTRIVNAAALAAFNRDDTIGERHLAEAIRRFEANERLHETARSWDDIVLEPEIRDSFALVQRLLEDPEAGRAFGLQAPRGAVLYGPPGTGKTTLARVLAHEAQCSFYAVTPSDVYSKWAGESERRVTEIFERARANRPSIIFLDEADALFGTRSSGAAEAAPHANHVVNQFLAEMDGIRPNDRVFILAATNRLDLIDPALLRAGRLTEKIAFPPPSRAGRRRLLELFSKPMRLADDVDFDDLADAVPDASGADIEELCARAARVAFMRCLASPLDPQIVTAADFDRALGRREENAECGTMNAER